MKVELKIKTQFGDLVTVSIREGLQNESGVLFGCYPGEKVARVIWRSGESWSYFWK